MENNNDPLQQGADEMPPVQDASYWYNKRQEEKASKQREISVEEEAEQLANQKLEEKMSAMSERFENTVRTQELKNYFAENPEFKEYEAKITAWWNDPSRRHLPVSSVALEAVGKDNLARIYGERALNQEREAKSSRIGLGSTRREVGSERLTPEKIETMSDAELNAAIKQRM